MSAQVLRIFIVKSRTFSDKTIGCTPVNQLPKFDKSSGYFLTEFSVVRLPKRLLFLEYCFGSENSLSSVANSETPAENLVTSLG